MTENTMNQIDLFNASLNEFDRLAIVAARTESQFLHVYHNNKTRLPGGPLLGGTEAEGIEFLREARERLVKISWK